MGVVGCSTIALIAYGTGSMTAFVLMIAMIGSLLAFMYYNWYPAKVFMGDVGTLSIGASIASAVIIGNLEFAGVIIIIPYLIDFIYKAKSGFPSRDWWGTLREDGKLYWEQRPRGLCQAVIKFSGGITERRLTIFFIIVECIFAVVAVTVFFGIPG